MFAAIAQNSNYFSATYAQEQAERTTAAGAADFQATSHEESIQKPRSLSADEKTEPDGRKKDDVELSREAQEISKLQTRDQEVRAHEAAHVAAGGSYAGAPSFSYERGPDGQSYAVGGEVSIDVSPIAGDPQATLQKAQQVRAAALAPAEPSGQDMKVAQRAQSMAAKALLELGAQQAGLQKKTTTEVSTDTGSVTDSGKQATAADVSPSPIKQPSAGGATSSVARLSIYA